MRPHGQAANKLKGATTQMAKTKKKKQPARSRPSYRKLSTVASGLVQTGSRGATPANLKYLYGIDDKDLADASPGLPPDDADLYRMMLYVPVETMGSSHVPDTAYQLTMKTYQDATRSSFETTCPSMLSFLLMGDDWDSAVETRHIMDAIGPVERMLPDKYYNSDDLDQAERHAHVQYGDAFATALSDIIDWSAMDSVGNISDWSARIMSLARTLLTEERIAELDERSARIFKDAIQWADSSLSAWTKAADETIRSMGLIPVQRAPEPV